MQIRYNTVIMLEVCLLTIPVFNKCVIHSSCYESNPGPHNTLRILLLKNRLDLEVSVSNLDCQLRMKGDR